MVEYFMGIDPGKKGAVAVINKKLRVCHLFDCPLIENEIDIESINEELRAFCIIGDSFCVIEKAQAMPGQGVTSMFNYGKGYGIYLGILTSLSIPFQEVRPQKWKKEFELNSDKSLSIQAAKQMFPSETSKLLKTKDGRAEALLIAEYARRIYK